MQVLKLHFLKVNAIEQLPNLKSMHYRFLPLHKSFLCMYICIKNWSEAETDFQG
jgi:hypothetical protein